MIRRRLALTFRSACLLAASAVILSMPLYSQSVQPALTLDHGGAPQSPSYQLPRGEYSFANSPASFYAFSSARVGETAPLESVTVRFTEPATITKIQSANADFVLEEGGSCVAGRSYGKGDSCIALVRFAPQGPGRRLGRLSISHTASPEPAAFGLGGYGYAPAIAFVPSRTYTVASTYGGANGVLNAAQNITVDGGDTLYIADTGNGDIRYLDSSGTLRNALTGATTPEGIAVDNFGNIFFDNGAASGSMYEVYNYTTAAVPASGAGTDTCTYSTSPLCSMANEQLYYPGMMSIDRYNNLLFANENSGAAMSTLQPVNPTFINLYSPFTYQETLPDGFGADADDNLYSLWAINTICEIQQQSLYDAELDNVRFTKVAGGRTCGYSGDGGLAGNAEIGKVVGQIAFDAAGDLYFTDTSNQRVRMIDVTTGIITTVVGTGTKGFTDATGNRSNTVALSNPTGLAVDSQGQIYVVTQAPSGAATQVIQQVDTIGILVFGNQTQGTTSAAQILTVTNTGNSSMALTNHVINGANAADFSIDPNTTSCVLTAGAILNSGQTCKIGILFKPSGTGTRSANLVLLDNTVTGSNTVNIYGTGTAPAPAFVPGSISFPVTTPTQSNTMPVTITNHGNVDLKMADISLAGSNAGMFSFTSNCMAGSIAPGASCTLNVAFKPSSTGDYSATLKFTDNAPSSPQAVFVSGTGQKPYTSATKLTSAANPAPACSAVTFKVTVSTSDGSPATGPVSLQAGALTLASGTLTNGAATLTVQGLAPGLSLITASYGGDTDHAGSVTTLSQMVTRGSCTTFHPPVPAVTGAVHDAPMPDRP